MVVLGGDGDDDDHDGDGCDDHSGHCGDVMLMMLSTSDGR